MRPGKSELSQWLLILLCVGLGPGDAAGLIIHRFGGQSLPPPVEAGSDGVEFVQHNWSDLEASRGGQALRLYMDETSIGALKHDPQVNIAPTVGERDGKIVRADFMAEVIDGDHNTMWVSERWICAEFPAEAYGGALKCDDDYIHFGTINIKLGGRFLLDRIRIVSGLATLGSVVRNFRVSLLEEAPKESIYQSQLRPIRPYIVEVRNNREQYLEVPIPSDKKTEFLQVAVGEHNEAWEVNEVEIYARGFEDKSTYISDILDFGAAAAWGDLRWSGRRDPGAKVHIQTRSGSDDDPTLYWEFTGRADEKVQVSRSAYGDLRVGESAGTTYDQEHWTFWSGSYDFADSAGAVVVSLGPRRFLQFAVDFIPHGEDAVGKLDVLEVRASIPPAASELVGEIFPARVEVGKDARFTYVLKPVIERDDTGFDRLELKTSSILNSVDSLRLDGVDIPFTVADLDENRFEINFPRVEGKDTGALIEVVFGARPLRFGSSFDVRVSDRSRPLEVPQRVSPGDATDESDGNTVSIATSLGVESMLQAAVAPWIFTPNGDQVNDVARVAYDLLEITGHGTLRVEIRDLAGRLIRQIYTGEDPIGHYERVWDGTDDAGDVVPPGVYLYRVSVEADRKEDAKVGMVHVVY